MADETPAARVRRRVLAEHADVLATVDDCADAVAAAVPTPTDDGERLRSALEAELVDDGVLERFPAVLSTAVDSLGATLPAEPVAGPPYVVVTSRGPMCRATTERGRLVVLVAVFDVRRGGRSRATSGGNRSPVDRPTRLDGYPLYRRNERSLSEALEIDGGDRRDSGRTTGTRERDGDGG